MEKFTFNKTKIVATVGPSSSSKDVLRMLIKEGVDIFRANFSHGTHEDHKKVFQAIRELNEELGSTVCVLQDLQGPKIRINQMEPNVELVHNQEFIITTNELVGNSKIASTSYKEMPQDVNPGDIILLDDGKIELTVTEVRETEVVTRVIFGGVLKSRKGINMPYTKISAPSLTKKDIEDLEFGLANGVEWIALSFVRKASDVLHLRDLIQTKGAEARIIAKIEKPEALDNIDEIIEVSDAIMVARGDLGVEILHEEVPMAQKMIVEKSNKAGKPVIIATQMMESMIENPRPTRAETNDVANAVMDGADALMLSAETASGKYPLEVIRSMVKTICSVERSPNIYYRYQKISRNEPSMISDSLVLAATKLSKDVGAKAIVVMTTTGHAALKTASHRPDTNIFAFTSNKRLLTTINLVWATRAYFYDKINSTDETIADVEAILKRDSHVKSGDVLVFLASMPIQEKGRTNTLKINQVK